MKDKEKNYRPNVAAVVLSPRYPEKVEFFIALRVDIENAWQFPQGGIDDGESSRDALFRELKEEIGTDQVKIVATYPKWLHYDFPNTVAKKMYPFDGQKQKYYLVVLDKDAKVDLSTEHPEFSEYKYVDENEVFEHITYFKKPIYKEVLKYFKNEGYI